MLCSTDTRVGAARKSFNCDFPNLWHLRFPFSCQGLDYYTDGMTLNAGKNWPSSVGGQGSAMK
jgi:hypothetical protein